MSAILMSRSKHLHLVSVQITTMRALSVQRTVVNATNSPNIPTREIQPSNNFGITSRRQGNYSKVSSRRVHANTLSILGNKEHGAMTADDLERRIKHLMSLTTEAKLCIQDCDESNEIDFKEEFESAKKAVDSASIAFSELLEELALTDEGIPLLNEIRKQYAPSVADLRSELNTLLKMKST